MLTDTTCKNAKAKDKPYKLADEKGMFLLVNPNGAKYFRLKYRINGKEKLLALGVYPDTSLKQAREKRDEAREQIANGVDPSETRKAVKQANLINAESSFEIVAREWFDKNMTDKSESHQKRTLGILERDIFPALGNVPIANIKAPELLAALRKIEGREAFETARRTLQTCGLIFRYGVATGRLETDVSQFLKGSLKSVSGGHFAAITEPNTLAALLRAIDAYSGSVIVRTALQIAPLVFVRPGELRGMEWSHIDFEAKEWRYLVTKTNVQHIVPLSKQVIELLERIKPLTQHGRFVLPSERTPNGSCCMSDMALLAALRRMGFSKDEVTVHGFRATARTLLDEVLNFRPDFIEHQLAHAVRDPNGRAYNRTAHLAERHKMMQAWADYLDSLKMGGVIIPFSKAA
ncbi:MAG: integrase arm-type DNA-binding domain-containing protein [Methylococcales bacterium]|nr:integrase arm-type DNA-binding domain-containing protein [Methylococcales bacterium]